jgi:DNA repair protein RadC
MENVMNHQDWTQAAEIEIIYKTKVKAANRPVVKCSKDIYQLLLQVWDENLIELQEQFKVVLLNRANRVLGIYQASSGGITGTVADPKLILIAALKSGAVAIAISHNHPSGNLKPSRADEELTCKIREAAKFLDIQVLDHLIISPSGYYSFADEGHF